MILRTAPLPRSAARTTAHTNRDLRAALWAGAGCLACGLLAGRYPPRPEKRLHAAANHGTSGWWVLRLPQQLGTPWALPVLALLGVLTHRPRLAVSAASAVPLEKLLEAGLKKGFARHRPAREDSDTVLHDDAPAEGGSFPSGHAALTMVAALLTAPYLPGPAGIAIIAAAGAVGVIRVRQGAHFPLDVAGGALLGTSVACALRAAVGASWPVAASTPSKR